MAKRLKYKSYSLHGYRNFRLVAAIARQGVRLGHVTPNGIVELPTFNMAYFDPRDTAGLLIEFVESKTVV